MDFFDVKGDVEALLAPRQPVFRTVSHPALHPGRAAAVIADGREIGFVGELHPLWAERYDLGVAPVVFELDLDAVMQADLPEYAEVSRCPVVSRDLALIVDHRAQVATILETLKASAPTIVRSVELFDVYDGKGIEAGKRSLAFRVLMQDTHRTLEDAEVETAIATIVRSAESSFGAKLRG